MKLNERSLAMWASSSSPVDKEGYLIKRGEMNKQFQRRWFVLKGNLLFYCAGRTEKEPLGVIILEEHSVAMSENRDTRYAFDITFSAPSSRVYTLAADSEELSTAWMRAIAHASFEYLRLMVQDLQRKVDELTESRRDTTSSSTSRDSRRGFASSTATNSSSGARRHDSSMSGVRVTGAAAALSSSPTSASATSSLPPSSSVGLAQSRSTSALASNPVTVVDMTTKSGAAGMRAMTSSSNALAVGHTTTSSLLDDDVDGGTAGVPVVDNGSQVTSSAAASHGHHNTMTSSSVPLVAPRASRHSGGAYTSTTGGATTSSTPPSSAAATHTTAEQQQLTADRRGSHSPATGRRAVLVSRSASADPAVVLTPASTSNLAALANTNTTATSAGCKFLQVPEEGEQSHGQHSDVDTHGDSNGAENLITLDSPVAVPDEPSFDLSDEQMLKQLSFQSMHKRSFLAGSPQLPARDQVSDHSEDLFS
eukprot:scpid68114/ scgid26480/ Sesquipedalian-1; 27 kDa inositol polyphosphate phosphatase interacting protein A